MVLRLGAILGGFETDLDELLKLRLAIARCGEMDCAKWWNTDGQLGPRGATVLRRGFPRTHHFAQARSVFAAASARCREVFSRSGATTLWWLGEEVEEAFDLRWEEWLDRAGDWAPLFEQLSQSKSTDPTAILLDLGLAEEAEIEAVSNLQTDASGLSVKVPGGVSMTPLLALGFSKGNVGKLVVPYAMSAA